MRTVREVSAGGVIYRRREDQVEVALIHTGKRWGLPKGHVEEGERGQQLMRRRGELLERPNAHLYETGGMRRTHLRGHGNILKRLLVHVAACNLGLWMRTLTGIGTPSGLQGRLAAVGAICFILWVLLRDHVTVLRHRRLNRGLFAVPGHRFAVFPCVLQKSDFYHGLIGENFSELFK